MKFILSLALTMLFVMGTFQLGASLQRISNAQVYLEAGVCQTFSIPMKDDACAIKANMAGRLDGGWAITPIDPPMGTFYVESNNLTYSYSRENWHLAYGGEYIIIGLLLAGVLITLWRVWRHIAQFEAHNGSAGSVD
jgi:hypothetical protein